MSERIEQAEEGSGRLRPRTAGGPRAEPPVMRMALAGKIGQEECREILGLLERLLGSGVVHVVIDFTEVSDFDYRGVRPLCRGAEGFRDRGGDVRLAGLSPFIHAVFRGAGAQGAFDAYASVEDAVGSFTRSIFAMGR